jgi:hypothetical protein
MPLCYSSEEARTVLDSLSAHIAIVDENGMILDTNRAWREFGAKNGMPEGYDAIGENYLRFAPLPGDRTVRMRATWPPACVM